MSEPLEYGRSAKFGRAPLILGLLSIACSPSAYAFFESNSGQFSYDLAYKIMWLLPIVGVLLALSGIACRKSSLPAWIGMLLNLSFLGLLTFARYY